MKEKIEQLAQERRENVVEKLNAIQAELLKWGRKSKHPRAKYLMGLEDGLIQAMYECERFMCLPDHVLA